MKELKSKQLETVAGGTCAKRIIRVRVDFSEYLSFTSDITIRPYLDGELLKDKIKTVDSSIRVVDLDIFGKGLCVLKVKIDNEIIKLYELNFEKGTYINIE